MYAFKIYAMQRAVDAGFRFILWMDTKWQPVGSMCRLWAEIERSGWYAPKQGDAVVGTWCTDEMLKLFDVTRDESMTIPLCYSGLVGLDFSSITGHAIWCAWRDSKGLWTAPHLNKPGEQMEPWGEKFSGHVSYDPRVTGHRHDEAALSLILYKMGLRPSTLGFLTLEDPNGFIGNDIKLVTP
jgi:hypothetical protein